MLFNSWSYLFFYLVFGIAIYWALPSRFRVFFIIAASLLFYSMWRWEFSLLMIVAAAIDFYVARKIYATTQKATRLRWLIFSLTVNLGMLVFFKYTYFIHDNLRLLASIFGVNLKSLKEIGVDIVLPLGISFFTFQTINYSIDIYRGILKPTPRFSTFLAYVTFWPHLMAGPILRASETIPQLESERNRRFDWSYIFEGMALVCSGLFKKVVIADGLAPKADAAFAMNSSLMSGLDVWIAAFLFGFQIYFDFAGYSDIAVGSARMLGIHIPENFNWPYLATSPRDFWRRWHISLSEWIRDYLYLPLTGQKFVLQSKEKAGLSSAIEDLSYAGTSRGRREKALFITWFIMGLWHGAGWNFVVWGLYHALLIFIYRQLKPLQILERNHPALSNLFLLPILMLGWIPFRSTSLQQTFELFRIAINPFSYSLTHRAVQYYSYPSVILLVIATWICHWAYSRFQSFEQGQSKPLHLQSFFSMGRILLVSIQVFLIIIYLKPVRQFIYFQF